MPVRKRTNKRSATGDAWSEIFSCGYDELHRAQWLAGVRVNDGLEPDLEEARCAWHRYGEAFLTDYPARDAPWALTEFGEPGGADAG